MNEEEKTMETCPSPQSRGDKPVSGEDLAEDPARCCSHVFLNGGETLCACGEFTNAGEAAFSERPVAVFVGEPPPVPELDIRLTARLRESIGAAARGALKSFCATYGSSLDDGKLQSAAKRVEGAFWGLLKTHPDVVCAGDHRAWPAAIAKAESECAQKAARIEALEAQCATLLAHRAVLRELAEKFRDYARMVSGEAFGQGCTYAFNECADRLDAALSSGEGRTDHDQEEKTLGS